MKKNVGKTDASLRVVGAAVLLLIALFVIEMPAVQILLALVAAVLATTAFLRTCPVYTYKNIDTTEASSSAHVPQPSDTPNESEKRSE